MILRPYQLAAKDSLQGFWMEHPATYAGCIVIPTAGGKTPIMAQLCLDGLANDWRCMVLAHRHELIRQTVEKIETAAADLGTRIGVGIYSATLGERDLHAKVTCGQIQSVYRRMADFGKLNMLLLDECHLLPPSGDGMFRTAIAAAREVNPGLLVGGLTATAYRTTSGPLCGPGQILTHIVHESGIVELLDDGYLCPLRTKQGAADADTSGLHVRAGEYKSDETNKLMEDTDRVSAACFEMVKLAVDRKSCLVFCCSIKHCEMVAAQLKELCPDDVIAIVTGKTDKHERKRTIDGFTAGGIRWVINCEVLTTGFDCPRLDCVVLLRPTMSPGLYYQMVGRGLRLFDGKEWCLVLDFAGNVRRHGPLAELEANITAGRTGKKTPAIRTCPACRLVATSGDKTCRECGYTFPVGSGDRAILHGTTAEEGDIIGGKATSEWLNVLSASYHVHHKNAATADGPGIPTMRVEYVCDGGKVVKEWVCFQHEIGSFPRNQAEKWWRQHAGTILRVPTLCDVAATMLTHHRPPASIRVKHVPGKKWPEVTSAKFAAAETATTPEPTSPATQPQPASPDWWSPAAGFVAANAEPGNWLAEGDTYF